MKLRAAAALLLALGLAAGCTQTTTHVTRGVTAKSTFGAGDDEAHALIVHCGVERWAVKTGTDADARNIKLTPVVPTTVADLAKIPVPAGFSQDAPRLAPVEETVYQVKATLTGYKLEGDNDVHLVLSDAGKTMIAEIPDPACVGLGSPLLSGITAARQAFDAKYTPSPTFTQANVMVTITGVAFFDTIHGQTGVAPNGLELHPVLTIQFGS